jgi:hypothetical protein
MPVIIDITPGMIDDVYREWSKKTGRAPADMTLKEFSRRMMAKIMASAKVVSKDELDAAHSEKR